MNDEQRWDWLEQQAKWSPTGISFDYIPSVDGEPGGFRFMSRHRICAARPTIRQAIDAAMSEPPRGNITPRLTRLADNLEENLSNHRSGCWSNITDRATFYRLLAGQQVEQDKTRGQ